MKVKLVSEYAQLPTRGSEDAAGLDLYCPFHIKVPADSQKKIPLGVAVEIPKGHMGLLVPRSSMSKTPLRCANSIGVIDADYRGELSIAYENISCSDYMIFRGDRIAQLIIVPVAMVDAVEVDELTEKIGLKNTAVEFDLGLGLTPLIGSMKETLEMIDEFINKLPRAILPCFINGGYGEN